MKWLALLTLPLLATQACNTCDAEKQCGSLDGYLSYYQGKLDPASMCGVEVQRGPSIDSGQEFHWDTSAGVCSCDAIEDDSGIYNWKNCAFAGASSSGASSGSTSGN